MPDSRFLHAVCDTCWRDTERARLPFRLIDPEEDTCCWCQEKTTSGIYRRQDPELVPCRGRH